MPDLSSISEKLEQVHFHGRYFSALCPFHSDSSPSLLVYPDGFRCKACDAFGSLDDLDKRLSRSPNTNKRDKHKQSYFVPWSKIMPVLPEFINKAHNTIQSRSLGYYFDKRCVSDMVDKSNLGYWDGWYTFPVSDLESNLVSVVLRAGESLQKYVNVRYVMPPNNPNYLYVPDLDLLNDSRNDTVFFPFGIVDALSLASIGLPSFSWLLGKWGSIDLLIDNLRPIRKKIVLIPDKDEDMQAKRISQRLGWRGYTCMLNYPSNCKDVNDLFTHERLDVLFEGISDVCH